MSAEEAFAIPLVLLNSPDGLRPHSSPPSHRMCARKIVAQIGGSDRAGRLPPKSGLVEIRQFGPDMRKASRYAVQRESAIVLLVAKPLLSACEQDLAVTCDGRR